MKTTKKNSAVLLLAFIVCLISGCRAGGAEKSFLKLIPTQNVNEKIILSQPPTLKADSTVECQRLLILNKSSDLIRFPIDYGIQLFVSMENGEWKQIANTMVYRISIDGMDDESSKKYIETQGGIPVFSKDGPSENFTPFTACPDLSAIKLPATVRVLIVGTVFHDIQPTNEKVAAYFDVHLSQ